MTDTLDPATTPPQPPEKAKKDKDKIRAAWISFVGRIVAQVVGAVASVVLGLLILQRYQQQPRDAASGTEPQPAPSVARSAAPRAAGTVALAVLPLNNFSPAGEEYFADGMTEALIADLTHIDGLRVISRTSTMRYKTQPKSVPEIARELDVDMVVEGSVVKAGDRVRVTAQLIDAKTDEHVWSGTYDHTLRDILTLQGEVAAAIAQEVKGALTLVQHERIAGGRKPVDPSVYDLYLRGRHAWNLRTVESLKEALAYFDETVRADSTFALAHAGLADTYTILGLPPNNVPETMVKARDAAERALALDTALSEAHTSLAVVHHRYDWDWEAADGEFRRALELNPGYITAHQWYAFFLAHQGRDREAVSHARQALQLDPLSWLMRQTLGMTHYFGRRYDLAEAEQRRALELEPSRPLTRIYLARALLAQKKLKEAIAVCEAMRAPRPPDVDALLAIAHYQSGNGAAAEAIIRELTARRPHSTSALARWHGAAGNRQAAIDELERALDERSDVIPSLRVEPLFDPIRPDPAFAAILRRARLGP